MNTPGNQPRRTSADERTFPSEQTDGGPMERAGGRLVPASETAIQTPFGVLVADGEAPPPRGRWRGILIGLLVLAAGGAGAGWYFGAFAAPVSADLRLPGVISANEVTVSSRFAGRIADLRVKEGDTVAAGAVIATLEHRELQALRDQQMAVLNQLTSQLGRGRDVVSMETERAANQVARSTADLAVARAQQRQAAAEVADLRVEAGRLEQLFERQLVARRDLDRARAQLAVAEARQTEADDRVTAMTAQVSLAEVERQRAGLARRDVDGTRAQIDQALAQLANLDAQLAEATVAAPIGGVVSLQIARAGEVVRVGDPIVTLVDLSDTWVRAEVEESAIGSIAVGDPLEVETASGERRTGRVTFISPEAGFATSRDVSRVKRDVRTFGIKVALPNDDRRLHAGMTAFVRLPATAPGASRR